MADPSLYSQFRLFFSGREGEFLDRFSGPQFCPIPLRRHGNVQRLTDLMDGNIGNFIPFCHLCYRHGPDFLIQGLPVIHIIGSSKLFNRFQWIDSHLSGLCLRRLLRSCLYRRRCTGRPGSSFLLKLMFLCICGRELLPFPLQLEGDVLLMIPYLQGSLKTVLSLQFLVFF